MSYRSDKNRSKFNDHSSRRSNKTSSRRNKKQSNEPSPNFNNDTKSFSRSTERNFFKNEPNTSISQRNNFRSNSDRHTSSDINSSSQSPYELRRFNNSGAKFKPNFRQRRRFLSAPLESPYSNQPRKLQDQQNTDYLANQNNGLEEDSIDLLWGRHATQAAFETGRPIHRIWCTSEIRSSSRFFQFLRDAKTSGVLVEEVSWARLAQITKGAVHQGIALQTAAAETLDLNKLIQACSSLKESALLLALDGLTDPHNLGAIIRSAEALGAHGIVLPQRRSAGLTGSVAKVAAGALEHLPVARVVNLNRSLAKLKEQGYSVIGLAEEGEVTLQEADLSGPLVVVIGSENKGLSLLTRKHCDQLVRIPLRGVTTSLNASIATSVVLYEIARNSWMKRISGYSPSPKLIKAKFT